MNKICINVSGKASRLECSVFTLGGM